MTITVSETEVCKNPTQGLNATFPTFEGTK